MALYTGDFSNEFQTSGEPYEWKFILEKEFTQQNESELADRLKAYAYILLADIGNLEQVVFEYSMDGRERSLKVTAQDAAQFFGSDIKEAGRDINKMEELVRKTGVSNVLIRSGDNS